MKRRVFMHEVAPRDGLQSENIFLPTADKIALINALSAAGLSKIEVTSFTSPKAIPALTDAEEVMRGIKRAPGVVYSVLIPNVRGAERALAVAPDEFNLVMSATEAHNQSNLRMSREASFAALSEVISIARRNRISINTSVSCSFGCPLEGDVAPEEVLRWAARFVEQGVDSVTLCDTTGMAYPAQVRALCEAFQQRWPQMTLALHFHNTRGMGLANICAGFSAGVSRFDASLGGIGGCPYAPGATGNVCTEDVVHMLQLEGCDTGVDLDALIRCARGLGPLLGHEVPGQIIKAGKRLERRTRSNRP